MNKKELIAVVAEKSNLTQKQVAEVVDAMLDTIVETLGKEEEVRLSGFCKFEVVDRKARQGRNPRTGEPIYIPARKAVRFKALKGLKEAVRS